MAIRVNVDGERGDESSKLLSPLDQGFLFGASVYETVRTYEGWPFLLARHLERLRESAQAIGIELDVTDEELTAGVVETVRAAGNSESSIRIIVSAGVGAIDYREGAASRPTVAIIVRPLPDYPESLYRGGAKAVFVDIMRAAPGNLSPRIKSSNVLNNMMALRQAQAQGAYEALMKNPRGEVCEGSMSNVFTVQEGGVSTPPLDAGILEGITRELLLDVARAAGIDVAERTILPDELKRADEVFITASSRQVVPIVQVDEALIGDGTPGPVTRRLIALYGDEVQRLLKTDPTRPSDSKGEA